MFLLDTNVVSELRKPNADRQVVAWAQAVAPTSLFLSVITLLELETGILRLERRDRTQGPAACLAGTARDARFRRTNPGH